MRFTIAVAGAFAAVAAAAESGTVTKSVAPSQTVSIDPVQASMYACVDKCPEGDVECQSHCIAVPSPNEDQVNQTTKCMAACEQGNGTEAETARYAACQQSCINKHFFVTSEGTPSPTGSPSKGNNNDDNSSAANGSNGSNGSNSSGATRPTQSSDDESSQTSGSPSSSSTEAPAEETPNPDSGASTLVGSSAAIFGLVAAFFAL